jgi:hypothetical protein
MKLWSLYARNGDHTSRLLDTGKEQKIDRPMRAVRVGLTFQKAGGLFQQSVD